MGGELVEDRQFGQVLLRKLTHVFGQCFLTLLEIIETFEDRAFPSFRRLRGVLEANRFVDGSFLLVTQCLQLLREFFPFLAGQLILILLLFLVEFLECFIKLIQGFFLLLGRGFALFEFIAGRFHLLGGLPHRLRSLVRLVSCEPLQKLFGFPA